MKNIIRLFTVSLVLVSATILFPNKTHAGVIETTEWESPAPDWNGLPCVYYNVMTWIWQGEPFQSELVKITQTRTRTCTQALVVEVDMEATTDGSGNITGFTIIAGTCSDADPTDGIDGCADVSTTENLDAVYAAYLAYQSGE